MDFFLFPKNRMVNFVMNDHSIRCVELKQTNPPTAQRVREHFLPPGVIRDGKIVDQESLTYIVEECLDEWKIHRRSVRFLVPDSLVIIRKLSIPADIAPDEITGYLYMEFGSTIHLPFDDPVFDFYSLGTTGKTKEILLFAAPEKFVMEYADLFSSFKLNPVAADISPLALYRLYDHLGKKEEKEILLTVEFDLTSVSLCIFENSVPYVMRNFSLEFDIEKWELIRTGMEMEYQFKGDKSEMAIQFEEIYREINKFIDFYRYSLSNGKKEVSKFLLNGDHPMLDSILKEMKERFDLPITMINLDEAARDKEDAISRKFYLALGLALKEVR